MSKEPDSKSKDNKDAQSEEQGKGYKSYLNYLKDNKNSKISAWIGKASDIYGEIGKLAQGSVDEGGPESSESMVASGSVIRQGALTKAVEIARLEWVKAKLESEDPVELSEKYNTRIARMNDEYHHNKLLFANISVIGFMKDKDSKADRLLVSKDDPACAGKVYAIDPTTGATVDTFEASATNCLLTLRRPG